MDSIRDIAFTRVAAVDRAYADGQLRESEVLDV
jgi:hypothetical protein